MLAILLLAALGLQTSITKTIAPGLTYTYEQRANPPLIVHVLRISMREKKVSLGVALGNDYVYEQDDTKGREALSGIAWRHGAAAAINGDFFPFTGDPVGLCVINGTLVSEPSHSRAAFGWKANGTLLFGNPVFSGSVYGPGELQAAVSGINRDCGPGENVVNLPACGKYAISSQPATAAILRGLDGPMRLGVATEGILAEVRQGVTSVPIPPDGAVLFVRDERGPTLAQLRPGTSWRFLLSTVDPVPWQEAVFAISGGPWLVRNGSKFIDAAAEKFDTAFLNRRHPRTVLGTTTAGDLLLVAIEGRSTFSAGATLDETSDIMLGLSARTAINLDGGGSTEMVIRDVIASTPSEGAERPIADALLVFADPAPPETYSLTIAPKATTLTVGQTVQLTVTENRSGRKVPNEEIVWGGSNGAGRINQFGVFTATKSGALAVSASVHGVTLRSFVLVQAPILPPNVETGGKKEPEREP